MTRMLRSTLAAAALLSLAPAAAAAQNRITTPKEAFGHDFGEDYFLASYRQISEYWRRLEKESDRIRIQEIGRTAEGRPHLMAIVSSPGNLRNLERYREISARLARADGLGEEEARALAREGKAVVWIDGGLHATETLGAQQLGEMVYQMVSRTDPETERFLQDVIILFVHANPDGNDLVADWYMRNPVATERTLAQLPRLYQKYIGHDNNRDFFASTQPETENINRVLYHHWFPQLLYNHHQSGPAGTVVYSPPFRDPYNYNLDPVLVLGIHSLGAAMHTRLAVEGKGGATMRSGGPYDGWWNGGIRNTATFHNTIAVLTEMIGNPTPMRIPFIAQRQVPSGDLALPVAPQVWHLRQSVEYSITLDRAVIDFASRMRENLLYNIYAMGRSSIARGNTDTWTINPRRIAEVSAANPAGARPNAAVDAARDSVIWAALHRPELRDPRGYILPADQPDFPTATKFINALRETGITVHRATADFEVQAKRYPKGSYVVLTAQPFRPHVIDMFEPQAHPDVFPYPGAPPTPPYDNAGWTFAFQMGVSFDRILDNLSGPFERLDAWNIAPAPGRVAGAPGASGFLTSGRVNNAFIAANRLLAAGAAVSRITAPLTLNGQVFPVGSFHVRAGAAARPVLEKAAAELGLTFEGTRSAPSGAVLRVESARIGLWDRYGGSMPAGWTRWILEQFEFPFQRVFAQELDRGGLNAKYDVLVFVDGAIPGAATGGRGGGGAGGNQAALEIPANLPEEYRAHTGALSVEKTLPALRSFIEAGGTVIAIGSSATNLAAGLGLPIENHLAENGAAYPRTRFYAPGSVLSARVDRDRSAAWGMPDRADLFFDNSPVWKLGAGAAEHGVKPVAWFDGPAPLRSGWAWGQQLLEGGAVAVEAQVGKGRVLLYGAEILQRAQPHGTFKFLLNGLYRTATER